MTSPYQEYTTDLTSQNSLGGSTSLNRISDGDFFQNLNGNTQGFDGFTITGELFPGSFGLINATTSTPSTSFGVQNNRIWLPSGYDYTGGSVEAGDLLSGSQTYADLSLSDIGVDTNVSWNWGSGAYADWIEFAASSIPEPASTSLLGLAGMGLLLRRRTF